MYGILFKMHTSDIVVIHDGFPQGGQQLELFPLQGKSKHNYFTI